MSLSTCEWISTRVIDSISRGFYGQLSILNSSADNKMIKDRFKQIMVDYISSCGLNKTGQEKLFAHLQLRNSVIDYQQLKFWGSTRSRAEVEDLKQLAIKAQPDYSFPGPPPADQERKQSRP